MRRTPAAIAPATAAGKSGCACSRNAHRAGHCARRETSAASRVTSSFASGTVEGVSLRTTRIRDDQGTVWHIPNGEIHRIANKSQN